MFRVLSIDGGGIKGIFAVSFLSAIEAITGKRVADHFDLIAGTSTGGIIALGLGLGYTPAELLAFYRDEGKAIFPDEGTLSRAARWTRHLLRVAYSPRALEAALRTRFGSRRLGESTRRLVIPAFDAVRGDVHVYKTAHHPRLKTDYRVEAWQVAMATASAPTYFPCYVTAEGSSLIDGGVWANNPAMVALTEAVAVLKVPLDSISMLSIGTTVAPVSVGRTRRTSGGRLLWASTAPALLLHGQSLAASNQTELILGRERFLRINPVVQPGRYGLDDVRAAEELVGVGQSVARIEGEQIEQRFLTAPAEAFVPSHHL